MMMAARILRPSREGWKLLVRALKHRWLSMAIWSWKVLPVRGSCGDRRPCQGRKTGPQDWASATSSQSGRGDHVHATVNRLPLTPSVPVPCAMRLILKPRYKSYISN